MPPLRLHVYVWAVVAASLAALAASAVAHPPEITAEAATVVGLLFVLSIAAQVLGVEVNGDGSRMSAVHIPHLTALLLVGPAAAAAMAGVGDLLWQVAGTRKSGERVAFNTADSVLSVVLAGEAYLLVGGPVGMDSLPFATALPALVLAGLVFFLVNWGLVAGVIALANGKSLVRVVRSLVRPGMASDPALTPLVYVTAMLYLEWGLPGLSLALIPVLGIRAGHRIESRALRIGHDLLLVMVKTLEAQDLYTSGHSLRVADAAGQVARRLGLSDAEAEAVETAALLHDIGKVGADYVEILRQEGPLTDEQYELIREHPVRGVEILQEAASLDPRVLRYVRHHHERVDGDGYPDGLEGEEIPLGARIITVCDSVDAMMTARPYRDALPPYEVRRELRRCRGSQFDPSVVDAFLELGILESFSGEPAKVAAKTPPTADLPAPLAGGSPSSNGGEPRGGLAARSRPGCPAW